ncbi:MAG: gamma-glutamyltransferase [Cyanobacteria bacterium P01_E01_bin.6]
MTSVSEGCMRGIVRFSQGFLSGIALVVLVLCSVELGSAQNSLREGDPLEFDAPANWAFPADRVAPTYGVDGMVTTIDRVASEIGSEMLRRGGNAIDAAVAVHFALAVVNPEAGNIGGGGFMIVRMADGQIDALDFRETAPLASTRNMFLNETGDVTDRSRIGHLAAGIPGSVAGLWEAHQRFGSLPWKDLVEPSVALAEGMIVHERLAQSLGTHAEKLQQYPATAAVFLANGQPPRVGDRLMQPDLAATLRRIASNGKDGFYQGETAELVEAEMQRGNGIITREDLANYRAVWRSPIVFQYRDHTVVSMPPPSSGGVAIAKILNIIEGYDLRDVGFLSRDHIHIWTEAAKRAFADRNSYLADPDFVSQPVDVLISDEYAAARRMEIHPEQATPSQQVQPGLQRGGNGGAPQEGEDTTHYSILDNDGNAVAVTTTINSLYGSLVTVTGAGFLLNNEMDDFAIRPNTPNQFGLVQGEENAIEPGKRMLSSMSPTIVLDATGHVKLVTGSPGGPTIISSVAQIISNIVDFNMDLDDATVAPRLHHQHFPDVLSFELNGLDLNIRSALQEMGHTVDERSGYQGNVQSILVLPDGTLAGMADPRRGGAAIGVRHVREVVQ